MNWYLARRLMVCEIAGGRPSDILENFFVVHARSLNEASKKAERLSKAEEHAYPNVYGQEVTWRFQDLIGVEELGEKQFVDGMCLYSRAFPGISRIEERSRDRLQVTDDVGPGRNSGWYSAMLLFRSCDKPVRETERLFLLRAGNWEDAECRALFLAKRAAESLNEEVVGLFQVQDISHKAIVSGTEVYHRFFRPSDLKRPNEPPREHHLTTAEFRSERRKVRASA